MSRRLGVIVAQVWISPFHAAGWLVGVVVKAVRLARESIALGYEHGSDLKK